MPDESSKKKGVAERGSKRTREGSSQTEDEDASDQHHKKGCKKCPETTNSRLSGIDERQDFQREDIAELMFRVTTNKSLSRDNNEIHPYIIDQNKFTFTYKSNRDG